MTTAEIFVALAGFITGVAAAWFWWKASAVWVPPAHDSSDEPEVAKLQDIDSINETLREAGRLNRRAALWTAASVVIDAVASFLPLFRHI